MAEFDFCKNLVLNSLPYIIFTIDIGIILKIYLAIGYIYLKVNIPYIRSLVSHKNP